MIKLLCRPGTLVIPVACVELQEQFGDRTIAELHDRLLLQGIKSCLAIIDESQSTEWESQNRMIAIHIQPAPRGGERERDRLILAAPDRHQLML